MTDDDVDTTTRGAVRSTALQLAIVGHMFKIDDVLEHAGLDQSKRRTAQRTLREMTKQGWLRHRSNSWRFRAGPLLDELQDELVDSAVRSVRREIDQHIPPNWREEHDPDEEAEKIPYSILEDWRDGLDPIDDE